MPSHFGRDDSQQIKKLKNALVKAHPGLSPLEELRFLYTLRQGDPAFKKGRIVEAEVRKLRQRERDRHEHDVEICVYVPTWEQKTERQKERLIFNQLLRIHVSMDEHFEPVRDEYERIKFSIIEPETQIAVFLEEVEEYGMLAEDIVALEQLSKHRMHKQKDIFAGNNAVGYEPTPILH